MVKKTVNYKDVMNLGFPEHTARDIIRQGKLVAIVRFNEAQASQSDDNMVNLSSKSPFDNKRLDLAPTEIVEELLGFQLFQQEKEKVHD